MGEVVFGDGNVCDFSDDESVVVFLFVMVLFVFGYVKCVFFGFDFIMVIKMEGEW